MTRTNRALASLKIFLISIAEVNFDLLLRPTDHDNLILFYLAHRSPCFYELGRNEINISKLALTVAFIGRTTANYLLRRRSCRCIYLTNDRPSPLLTPYLHLHV